MAISYVGGATGVGNNPIVLPAHGSGDFAILLTVNTDAGATPDQTSGFTNWYASGDSRFDIPGRIRAEYRRLTSDSYTVDPNPMAGNLLRIVEIFRGVRITDPPLDTTPWPGTMVISTAERIAFNDSGTQPNSMYFAAGAVTTNGDIADETDPPASINRLNFINGAQQIATYAKGDPYPGLPANGPLFSEDRNYRYVGGSIFALDGAYLVQTLEDVELLSTAEITDPPPPIIAELTATLDDIILESEATIPEVRSAELIATLDDIILESEAEITLPEITAELVATLDDVRLRATARMGIEASLIQTLDDVRLKSTAQASGITASLVSILDDVQLDSRAIILPVGAHLTATLEDVVLRSEATITQPQRWHKPHDCCTPSICSLDPCELICNFVSILPSGPLWDEPKRRVLEEYSASQFCATEPRNVGDCGTIVDHAVYAALKLYDVLRNGLFPALREANPMTAFDTMDDWLDRLNWRSCVEDSCSTPWDGSLLPTQIIGPCGTYTCELEYEPCLIEYLKHATIIALTRLQLGGIKNLCFINNVIEPFGAVLFPTPGGGEECPATLSLAPTRESFPIWTKQECLPQASPGECLAYHEPNKGSRTPLPDKVYPGLMAAECIIRSMLPRSTCIELRRLCEVPELIPNYCSTEM